MRVPGKGDRKKWLFAVATVALLSVAVAIPTLAGGVFTANKSASTKKTAKRALKKATEAETTAAGAATAATGAKATAETALARTVRVSFLQPLGTAEQQVASLGGLRIFAQCVAGNILTARADTTVSNSIIHISAERAGTGPLDFQDEPFNVGDPSPSLTADGGDNDNVTGMLVYRNGSTGQVVTMTYLLEESYLGANDCAVLGTATVV